MASNAPPHQRVARTIAWPTWATGPRMALAGVLAVAAWIRLWIVWSPLGRLDADEAVTGVMALRIPTGDFPAYFGVQNYQGALEQYLQAPAMLVAPSSPFALRTVQLLLAVAICVATYFLAKRICRSPWAGVLAAALLAVGPYYFVAKGMKSHGAYAGATLAVLVMLLLLFRLGERSSKGPLVALGAGIAAGIALWESPMALYVVIPAGLWLLGTCRAGRRALMLWGAGGMLIGLAPAVAYLARHGLHSPTRSNQQPATNFAERVGNLVDPVIARFAGVAPGTLMAAIITAVLVALVGVAVWTRRRGLRDLLTMRCRDRAPIDVVILAFLLVPIIYGATPFTWLTSEPRYLFVLYPLAAIAAVWGLWRMPWSQARLAAAVTLIGILGATLLSTTDHAMSRARHGGVEMTSAIRTDRLPAVADELTRHGVTAAYADYWIAIPLQFASGDTIDVGAGAYGQFPDSEARVAAAPSPAVVTEAGPAASAMGAQLRQSGRRFQEVHVAGFTLFMDIAPAWRPPVPR